MPKPAPSEWGKLNAGQPYGILAIDLGRAIFGVAWGKYELPLIYCLIEHSWVPARSKRRGEIWPDPMPCNLNINALSVEWGYPRQRLYEARDMLKAKRFLLEDRDGCWINKNAHEWVDPASGHPLLAPKMLLYASRGRSTKDQSDNHASVTPERDTAGVSHVPDNHASVTPERDTHGSNQQYSVTPERDIVSRSSVTSEDASTVSCHAPACHDVTVQRDTMSRSSVTSHGKERAQDLIRFFKITTPPLPACAHAGEGEGEAPNPDPPMMPCPTEETAMLPPSSGNHDLTRAELEHCWEILWCHFGKTSSDKKKLCEGFFERQKFHPFTVWIAAIREAYRRDKTNLMGIGYIDKIAQDYEVNGIPDPRAVAAPNGTATQISRYPSARMKPSRTERKRAQSESRRRAMGLIPDPEGEV